MKLRGSINDLLISYAEVLREVIKEDTVADLKAGVLAVIHSLEAGVKTDIQFESLKP